MGRRERVIGLLMVLALLLTAKLGQQLYRWYAFAEERTLLGEMHARLEVAGVAVIRTQLHADSLRGAVERMDVDLEEGRHAITAYDRFARDGALPSHLYGAYRHELDAYNRRVGSRNERFEEWKGVVVRNHRAVQRYNALADSMRMLAERIGEPYYQVPTPVELAVQHGVLPRPN